jgi:hypothetical protein
VAALFVVHSEREGVELILHASIAIALVMAALAQVSVILAGEEGRALRIFAALLLVIGGLLRWTPSFGPFSGPRHLRPGTAC